MQNILPSLRRIFRQPAFLVVVAVLLIAAVGLNGATQFLQLHFKKLPVPLSRPLTEVVAKMGPWQQVSIDEALSHEFQEALATDNYVFRDYVDTRLITDKEIAQFKDKTPQERKRLLLELQLKKPQAVINMGLTYYTGLVDTVAHVPDRCYIADGYEPSRYDVVEWDALKNRTGDHKVRFIVFEDSVPGRSVAKNVAYFFHCDGQYLNDPIGVRKSLASLTQRYGYYMKVELQTVTLKPDEASRVMNDFLTTSLPEIEKCLPDWAKLNAGSSAKTAG